MDSKALVAYFESHLDEMIGLLRDCTELESPSHEDKAVSDRCGEFFQKLFRDAGFQVETIPQSENGDCIVARTGSGQHGTLCVGHYDTVFPIGFLARNPFRVESTKAFGPGLLDMKGGIIMGYMAVKALKELNMFPQKRITFFLNGDEESGSFHSSDLIVAEAKKHDNVIVLEPGYDEIGSIKPGRYGRATYHIIAHGRSAHSGSNPEEGINPLEELSHQLLQVITLNDLEHGVSVAPICFKGGIPGTCVIPETASFSIDVRTRDVDLQKKIDDQIRGLQPVLEGIRLEIQGGIDKPVLPRYEELIDMAAGFAKELGITQVGNVCKGGSDGNFTGGAGVPTIDGMGMSGLYLHTPHEYIHVDHIAKRTALVALMLKNM